MPQSAKKDISIHTCVFPTLNNHSVLWHISSTLISNIYVIFRMLKGTVTVRGYNCTKHTNTMARRRRETLALPTNFHFQFLFTLKFKKKKKSPNIKMEIIHGWTHEQSKMETAHQSFVYTRTKRNKKKIQNKQKENIPPWKLLQLPLTTLHSLLGPVMVHSCLLSTRVMGVILMTRILLKFENDHDSPPSRITAFSV